MISLIHFSMMSFLKKKDVVRKDCVGGRENTWTGEFLANTFPVIPMIAAVMARINLVLNATFLKREIK